MAAITSKARRLILPHFLSVRECKELEFIHKSCGVVGYRPSVLSTTMSHLVATRSSNLIMPLLPIRERLREVVEETFDRQYELFLEFTGLISWMKGASIGWHSDDNREYLQQRQYSAVCYLNNYEQDFKGGLFHFKDGEPSTLVPAVGTVVIYSADAMNLHCVDEVTSGERCTLALWFTSDQAHDEDQKIIRQICSDLPSFEGPLHTENDLCRLQFGQNLHLHPIAASSVMYCVRNGKNISDGANDHVPGMKIVENEFTEMETYISDDLRIIRMASMGVFCCFTSTGEEDQNDGPVEMIFKHTKVPCVFSNSLDALQVVQFHQYRRDMRSAGLSLGHEEQSLETTSNTEDAASDVQAETVEAVNVHDVGNTTADVPSERRRSHSVNDALPEINTQPQRTSPDFVNGSLGGSELDDFLQSVAEYRTYSSRLWGQVIQNLPSWRAHGILVNS